MESPLDTDPKGERLEEPVETLTAKERLERLERIAMALGAAQTSEEVADVIITEGLASLGGNAGAVGLLTPNGAEIVTVRCQGYPPDVVARYSRYPSGTSLPTSDAARSRAPIFIESRAERDRLYPHLAGNHIRGGRGATVALPLIVRGQVLGGMALSFPCDRSFRDADRAFMLTIAQLCAQALDRARSYDSAQQEIAQRAAAEKELASLLEREHHVAATLQRSLLRMPPADAFPGLDLATRYESASSDLDVGGDFLDAFEVAPGQVALVVGDVSGKGLAAAASTSEAKYTLRALLREYGDPALALTRLNKHLAQSQSTGLSERESFLALALILVETDTGKIACVGAGIEPPLIVRADGDLREIPVAGLPLAVLPEAEYVAVSDRLAENDLLVVVTDGITEARQGSHCFGYEGLVHAALAARSLSPLGKVAQAILDQARAFAGGSLRDDTAILLVRRRSG